MKCCMPGERLEIDGRQPRRMHCLAARQEILEIVAELLGERVAADQPLMEAGLDSIGAVELRNAVAAKFGVTRRPPRWPRTLGPCPPGLQSLMRAVPGRAPQRAPGRPRRARWQALARTAAGRARRMSWACPACSPLQRPTTVRPVRVPALRPGMKPAPLGCMQTCWPQQGLHLTDPLVRQGAELPRSTCNSALTG